MELWAYMTATDRNASLLRVSPAIPGPTGRSIGPPSFASRCCGAVSRSARQSNFTTTDSWPSSASLWGSATTVLSCATSRRSEESAERFMPPPSGGLETVLACLSRYTHRVAISNGRLIAFDSNEVSLATALLAVPLSHIGWTQPGASSRFSMHYSTDAITAF
jgi:hypothetical protein